ncbi:hypothetical protein THAOC_06287 [Thalassiosira oceanica]|uniref:Letm1 RBD domain-containing protein n=1 Tax=Thalassiosira oceanica TaxID=159749 RepID=K0TLW7_THAOC|nr:hypothetical protein THAOC_06287 [Thalassiosira oceanica]|eukprot:EJK72202.1 hypothetical protein THAOC_06287 [Thalassiosira oceanica]
MARRLLTTCVLATITLSQDGFANASAIAAGRRLPGRRRKSTMMAATGGSDIALASSTVTSAVDASVEEMADSIGSSQVPPADQQSGNPLVQLVSYVKNTIVNFKDGLGQMNADHRRCNGIRTKQVDYAKAKGIKRPRGIKGIQVGGISFEEYCFLRKGLVDRNKLFAVTMVSLCLPNYFVYYMWSFPDMLPSPFMNAKSAAEMSRERCHAVISTMLDIEKSSRIPPWTSKLNPFGKRATDRAMERLSGMISAGSSFMEEFGGHVLAGNVVPKQILKGLGKAISADPLNKGASPFGIGPVKHAENIALVDEFLVNEDIDLKSIPSELLAEACSARLIGGQEWTDAERVEALSSWLHETEMQPREVTKGGKIHYNGNLARVVLMCYNVVDSTRDARSDSALVRSMYQGQKQESVILS